MSACCQFPHIRCCHESERVVGPMAVRQRCIHHFLLKEEDTALLDRLQQMLESGVSFGDIVNQYSNICPNPTGSENIGQGLVDKYQLLQCPEFAEVVFGVPCRTVARCKTRFGWHLIQVLGQRSNASLPGFKLFPFTQIGTWSQDVTTRLDCSKDTYLLCQHGIVSDKVANLLQLQGFGSVYTIAGGMNAYAKDVDPSLPTYKETRVCLIPYAIEVITRQIP